MINTNLPQVNDAAQFIVEPPELWSSRVPSKLREQAPRVVESPHGGQAWAFDGGAWLRPVGLEATAGHGPLEIKAHGYNYAGIRPGTYDAAARLTDMDIDEVKAASIFPSFGLSLRNILDPELNVACTRAYNDGLWDWAGSDRHRLIPHALIPASGLDDALTELKRVIKLGYKGIVFGGYPNQGMDPQPEEDAFWAECAESGIVVNILRGGPVGPDRIPTVAHPWIGPDAKQVRINNDPIEATWAQAANVHTVLIAGFILTGILDRFPDLKLAMIDAGAGWLAQAREMIDWNYRYSQFMKFAKLKYLPSDYIKRQIKATVKNERSTIEIRHDIGIGALMWASHYPNSTTSWPSSRHAIREDLRAIPTSELRQIVCDNWIDLYKP
ncbi:amidohydrolase [Dehalococcoidia bacterium]|nr:amidohydrolase [Dehalococcoidia bacterium]